MISTTDFYDHTLVLNEGSHQSEKAWQSLRNSAIASKACLHDRGLVTPFLVRKK